MASYYKANQVMARVKEIHIAAAHIEVIRILMQIGDPGNGLEWMLSPKSLHKTLKIMKFIPETNMFTSNANNQFRIYFSYKAYPKAKVVDSIIVSSIIDSIIVSLKFYVYPPFSAISRIIEGIYWYITG